RWLARGGAEEAGAARGGPGLAARAAAGGHGAAGLKPRSPAQPVGHTVRALIQDHLRSGQGPCVSLFSSIFGRFSTPAGTETHPDRRDLTRSAFCTKNQPLTSILRPIRDRFPIWLDPCPAFF
ncbi:MAG: hypothetical protein GY938_00550, partial [Ketobacter sp.]|nr:hypothetical protein [Ketobacter sp.]